MLKTLFGHELEDRKWYHIIGWWEVRRIAFNLILLISGIISITIMSLVVDGVWDFIHPLSIFGFAFLANFFYTGGWIIELLVKTGKQNTNSWGSKSFKIGLIISICFTFIPPLLFSIGGIVSGERFSSPYSHFASERPDFNDLVGTYKMDSEKSCCITDDDKRNNINLTLNADSTFSVENIPTFGFFENYELCNGTGKWTIRKYSSFDSWSISMRYDSLYNSQTSEKKDNQSLSYFIYNNEPPYKLYEIVSDPDSWAGILYEK